MKILWKEWHQQRWLFLFGCLAGITLPIFEMFGNAKYRSTSPTGMGGAAVMVCGALFAIILAVATTYNDSKKGLDNFWQSKPLHIWKLFAVKFILGAVVLSTSFLFVMSLDFWSEYKLHQQIDQTAWTGFCYTYPIALFLFAATMFLLVVLRDSAKTVLLAIWLALLIYFLPLLIGSLGWLNIFEQLDGSNRRYSLLQYIIWRCSLPENFEAVGMVQRPPGIPVSYYSISWTKLLWQILSSPGYLQYLFFLGVAIAGSVGGVVLTVIAFKHNWRWRPGQKTIAWTLGLSAAFIFGVAMLQVGHNLEPIKEWNGKKIVDPAIFDWSYMPASFVKEGIPEGQLVTWQKMYFDHYHDAVCVKDDLMFRVSCGYQWMKNKKPPKYEDEVIRHFVVQIYRFPYWDNSDITVSEGMKQLPDFVAGAMRLFSTEPVRRYGNQSALGCFVKDSYLYTAYRPQKNKENGRLDINNMPIYFATIDISNPEKPTLVENIEIKSTTNFTRGFANYGDYCYLSDGAQLVIISVAQTGSPEIVRQIPYVVGGGKCGTVKNEKDDYSFDLGDDPGFPSRSFSVIGDKLLCNSYTRIAILDLVEPTKPKVIYDESLVKQQFSENERIQATAYRDNYIYISTNNGLYIRKLAKQADGTFASELVGKRIATPIERLAGRQPLELLFHKDYLVEASGGFGLIVYDVSDPSHPKRVYHAATRDRANDVGIWNDLIYIQNHGFKVHFFDIPETN